MKKVRQEAGLVIREQIRAAKASNPHINYGLGKNTLTLKVLPKTLKKWLNRR